MMELLKVACLQMTSTNSVEQNLVFVDQQMRHARDLGVELIQLPENFAQMPIRRAEQHIETPNDGVIQSFLSSKSKQYQMMVVAGSIPIQAKGRSRPHARCLVFDHSGVQIAAYNKIHLFDVDLPDKQNYKESATYLAGEVTEVKVVETSLAKLGLSICYDLRFPELYRMFAVQGVEIVMVPSAFTATTGQAHWRTLLRARAIENQTFVMAAAQVGRHDNDRETWGHSMIIDPWGVVLSEFDDEHQPPKELAVAATKRVGLLIADLDLNKLADLRVKFPALTHRRL
ncbi:MAG: putative amidohydrolase [Arenicella sp.]|jgi:predicted amidohydrolase